ncbi:MAG: hypothetical protein V4697_02860 [Patescibacteria group bacterium]
MAVDTEKDLSVIPPEELTREELIEEVKRLRKIVTKTQGKTSCQPARMITDG